MVTNALVPAVPYAVEYQFVSHDYLVENAQHHPEEIFLSRINPDEHTISDQQPDILPFIPREGLQKRVPFAGDFFSGFAFPRSIPGKKASSRWVGDYRLFATYRRDGYLHTNSIDKGTYVDLYF